MDSIITVNTGLFSKNRHFKEDKVKILKEEGHWASCCKPTVVFETENGEILEGSINNNFINASCS